MGCAVQFRVCRACVVCANPQGWDSAGSRGSSRTRSLHKQPPAHTAYPSSGDCAPTEDLSPCQLGGMRLYSHASKVKVCATVLACRYRSRKRNLFSMQLRILEKSGVGYTMRYYNHLAIIQTQSQFQIRRLGSICKCVCIFFKVFGKLVTFPR